MTDTSPASAPLPNPSELWKLTLIYFGGDYGVLTRSDATSIGYELAKQVQRVVWNAALAAQPPEPQDGQPRSEWAAVNAAKERQQQTNEEMFAKLEQHISESAPPRLRELFEGAQPAPDDVERARELALEALEEPFYPDERRNPEVNKAQIDRVAALFLTTLTAARREGAELRALDEAMSDSHPRSPDSAR